MTAQYVNGGGLAGLTSGNVSITPHLPSAPTPTAVGDLLVAAVWVQAAVTIVPPSGWAEIAHSSTVDGTAGFFSKVATGSDGNPTFNWTGAQLAQACVFRFVGADHLSPIGAVGTIARGVTWERDLLGPNVVTTTRRNSQIVSIDVCSTAVFDTYSDGWQQQFNGSAPANYAQFAVQTRPVAALGGTTGSMLYYGGAEPWAAIQFELLAGPTQLLNNVVLDQALAYIASRADTIHICQVLPESYADLATASLGYYTAGTGNVFPSAITNGDPSGRQITSITVPNGIISTGGTIGFWGVADAAHSVLLASGPLDSHQDVHAGQFFAFSPISIRLPGVDG